VVSTGPTFVGFWFLFMGFHKILHSRGSSSNEIPHPRGFSHSVILGCPLLIRCCCDAESSATFDEPKVGRCVILGNHNTVVLVGALFLLQ
jgi:hypothetical protein